MYSVKPKPCCEVKIDDTLFEDNLIKDFICNATSRFVFVDDICQADIYVTRDLIETRKDLIQILISSSVKPLSFDIESNVYPFQPFLYEDNSNLQDQGENLFLFVETVAKIVGLSFIDNTILRLC